MAGGCRLPKEQGKRITLPISRRKKKEKERKSDNSGIKPSTNACTKRTITPLVHNLLT